jgi:hypothetical protein
VHGPATQFQNPDKAFFSGFRINIFFFPVRAAIIQAVPASRCAKIVGNQPAGYELSDRKVIHYSLKFFAGILFIKSLRGVCFFQLDSIT